MVAKPPTPPNPNYRGPSLAGDQILQGDQYLMSPNRRFCAQLGADGSFNVFWTKTDAILDPPPEKSPAVGEPLWASPRSQRANGSQFYFLAMQTDGNLVVYEGVDFQHQSGVVWAIDRASKEGGTYVLHLDDDGSLSVTRNGNRGWTSNRKVKAYAPSAIISAAGDRAIYKALSCKVAVVVGGGVQAVRTSSNVSVTDLPQSSSPTPDQLWQRLDVVEVNPDGGEQLIGTVLMNQRFRQALTCNLGTQTLDFSTEINAATKWTFGTKERGRYQAIRPAGNETINLDIKGDPPYDSGAAVHLWRWTENGADNLIWQPFAYAQSSPLPPWP